jgi:hypothetical protein
LSGIDPLFASWQINRNWKITEDEQPRLVPLAAARKRIAEIVKSGVARDDFDEPTPRYGYSVLATAGARGPRHISFSAWTGTQVPIDPTFPKSVFHVPWIICLSAKHAAGVRVAREILTERTPDGGLLMSATTDRLDPMNPEHVRRARILAETLIACTS